MAVQRTFWSTRREKKKKAQHERAAYQIFHQGQSPTQAPNGVKFRYKRGFFTIKAMTHF